MLQPYVTKVYDFLIQFEAPPLLCTIVSYATVYGLLIYAVVAVVILIGKLTKRYQIKKSDIGIMSAICLFGFVFSISSFIPIYQYAIVEPWGGLIGYVTTVVGEAIRVSAVSDKIILLGTMLLTLVLLGVFILIIYGCLFGVWLTFQSTVQKNGLIMGILVGIYEIFAGFFWAAAMLALFSIGVAIALLPILILYSNKRVIYVEDSNR